MKPMFASLGFLGLLTTIACADDGLSNPPTQDRVKPARAKRGNPPPKSGGILDEQRRYSGHAGAVTDLAVAKDGRHVVSSSLDQTIRFWDLDSGKVVRTLKGHVGPVFCVDISADAKRVVSGGADRTVRIWDVETGKEINCLAGHGGGVLDVALSPNGMRILSAGTGAFREPKRSHEQAWQPEGDYSIRLWNSTSGELIRNMAGHTAMVRSVAFSKDGSRASPLATMRPYGSGTSRPGVSYAATSIILPESFLRPSQLLAVALSQRVMTA